jgi:uncharacterized protein YjbJ (UPF0337 family)
MEASAMADAEEIGKKAGTKAGELKGKAKEAAGKATDDEDLEAEGKGDQVKSNLKQAGQNLKNTVKGKE